MIDKTSFGLKVQNLRHRTDKVLVIGHATASISGDGWFSKDQISELIEKLRLPPLKYLNQTLGHLRKEGLIRKSNSSNDWSLTPNGRVRFNEVLNSLELDNINFETGNIYGSEFGHALHSTIPPEFAPPKWQKGINRLLSTFPFENNVFLMTRFPKDDTDEEYLDLISDTINVIREVLVENGLYLHLASDRQIDDDLLGNVAAHMWACNYGIGIFENRLGRGLNYNVVTEIGAMLMTGRRCALIKDTTVPDMPTDIAGLIHKPIDLTDVEEVKSQMEEWVNKDLNLN